MDGQPLVATGHAKRFVGEGGDDEKPQAMPSEDAHTNKNYLGRSGTLKAGRPRLLGGNGNTPAFRAAINPRRKRK